MRIALIGPVQSGKSTLFAACAETGGSHVDLSRPDQEHLAVVKVPDERLDWLAELVRPRKVTPAELEVLDVPGFDLSDAAGRGRAKAHWPSVRQSDMLVLVVRGFGGETAAAYRGRVDAAADVEELRSEMLFADLEQATQRVEKLEQAVRKPTPRRDEQQRELELMRRLVAALEEERPIAEAVPSDAEAKMVRSFAFLSLKPALAVLNCDEDAAAEPGPEQLAGLGCLQLSVKIEEELAELAGADRAQFLADLGLEAPARDRLIRSCYEALELVSFFTAGEQETRAWSVPRGTDAVTAAGQIHTDIARGFIRAETVAFDDLRAAGDMKGAKAAGTFRLEGKGYEVQDGDVVHFRFNV